VSIHAILIKQSLVRFIVIIFEVKGLGYQNDTDPNIGKVTLVDVTIDPDYACTLF
jgi:hypothetical protein